MWPHCGLVSTSGQQKKAFPGGAHILCPRRMNTHTHTHKEDLLALLFLQMVSAAILIALAAELSLKQCKYSPIVLNITIKMRVFNVPCITVVPDRPFQLSCDRVCNSTRRPVSIRECYCLNWKIVGTVLNKILLGGPYQEC